MLKKLRYYLTGDSEPRVPTLQLAIFTRQLGCMLDAGIPLHRALDSFAMSAGEEDELGYVLGKVSGRVASGFRYSRALRLYPTVFSPVYVGLIETGENTGRLSDVLERLSTTLEKEVDMKRRLISTLTYPIALMSVAAICLIIFVLFVLPATQAMFNGMGLALPWPTRLLMATRQIVPVMLWALAALVLGMRFQGSRMARFVDSVPRLRWRLHTLPFKIPMIGKVYQKVIITRILYSMASMIDSGLSIVEGLKGCINAESNLWIVSGLRRIQAAIIDGQELSTAMKSSGIFPDSAVHVVRSGEESSSLPRMIQYAATMFDEDTQLALMSLSAALEPILMAGMGLVVGFIVIAAMLPTLQLIANL